MASATPSAENPPWAGSLSRHEMSYLGQEMMFLFFPIGNPEWASAGKDHH